jgi:hypothetical protein
LIISLILCEGKGVSWLTEAIGLIFQTPMEGRGENELALFIVTPDVDG